MLRRHNQVKRQKGESSVSRPFDESYGINKGPYGLNKGLGPVNHMNGKTKRRTAVHRVCGAC